MARRVWLNEDGGFRHDFYGRFPIGGYAPLKLATAPFGNDSAAKLLADASRLADIRAFARARSEPPHA